MIYTSTIECNKDYKAKKEEKRKSWLLLKVTRQKKKSSTDKLPQVKKKKAKSRWKLVKELDSIFSRFIRLRDADKKWICTCVTCWDRKHRKEMHCCHFVTRWNYKYRWSENNCFAGCYKCNVILHWNYISYTLFMVKKYWEKKVIEMQSDKELVKISTPKIIDLIEHYKYDVDILMREKPL